MNQVRTDDGFYPVVHRMRECPRESGASAAVPDRNGRESTRRRSHMFTPLNVSCYTCIRYKRSTEIVKYKRCTEIVKLLLSDSRTDRIRPTDEENAQVYDEVLRNLKSKKMYLFRGLIQATQLYLDG